MNILELDRSIRDNKEELARSKARGERYKSMRSQCRKSYNELSDLIARFKAI